MKYREEVMSKIFTYITVIVLLGIIAFEAYMLQAERSALSELEKQNRQTNKDLITVREINYDLQTQNAELEKFYSQWTPYAAFTKSIDVDRYKSDLFSRIDLIPEDALDEWKAKMVSELEKEALQELIAAAETDGESEDSKTDAQDSAAEENTAAEEVTEADLSDLDEDAAARLKEEIDELDELELTFENPEGENLFLSFGHSSDPSSKCLIYTSAFIFAGDKEGVISLLYELPMNQNMASPLYDKNDEIFWNCVAYNIGDGWMGIRDEKEGEEE